MTRLCLCMIVKNEAHVIERALSSVRPYISHWEIADTGSTDNTPALVLEALDGIPGMLSHDPWTDFATNRNLTLRRARESSCEYVLVLDADETFHVTDRACLEMLERRSYGLRTYQNSFSYLAERLFNLDIPWRYRGAIHEEPVSDRVEPLVVLEGVHLRTHNDGARSQDPAKYERDIATMQALLRDDPENARLWFHLGLTCRAADDQAGALRAFERRWEIENDAEEERWYAGYMRGRIFADTGQWWRTEYPLLQAYANYPATAEPLYWLGRAFLGRGEPERALPLLELAASKQKPASIFLREDSIYEWEAQVSLARCLVELERVTDANLVLMRLIQSGRLPDGVLEPDTQAQLTAWAKGE